MKCFGLARSVITAALVSAAFAPAVHAAGSFSNMFTFGDSLSDVGTEWGYGPGWGQGNHWTYNNQPLWDQLLANQYGLTLTPANPLNPLLPNGGAGNAYAQGDAQANNAANGVVNLAGQVNTYLKASGGKADPNALYTVWIGGNDVPAALALAQTNGAAAAQQYIGSAVQTTATEVATLQALGAQHIIVANLPNVGYTPAVFNQVAGGVAAGFYQTASSQAAATQIAGGIAAAIGQGTNQQLVGLLSGAIVQATTGANAASTVQALQGAALAAAHSQLNAGTNASGAAATASYQAAGRAAESAIATSYANIATSAAVNTLLQAGLINSTLAAQLSAGVSSQVASTFLAPTSGLSGTIYSVWTDQKQTGAAAAANQLSQLFNATENGALAKSGAIMIDINKLMTEVFQNPTLYGFTNVTGYACPTGVGANVCTSGAAGFDSTQKFFFADDFHPTPAATAAVYQYMYSVLQAPYFAAQLPNAQQTSVFAAEAALDNRQIHARTIGTVDMIASLTHLDNKFDNGTTYLGSTNNNTAITVGADLQYSNHYSFGAEITKVSSNTNFGSTTGSFSTSDYLMTFFNHYENGPWSAASDIFVGNTRFSNIQRIVQIGADTRQENAGDSGNQAGVRFTGSYGFSLGKFTIAPTLSATYREGKVGGYLETANDGSTSSSMSYQQQRIDSLLVGGGFKVDGQFGRFDPYFSAMYFDETMSKNRNVTASIAGAATSFDTSVQNPDHSYTALNLGTHVKFSQGVYGYLDYSYNAGLSDQKRDYWGAGVQASF